MTSLPRIELISDDNGRSYFRSLEIQVGTKRVLTPSRALEPRRASAIPEYDTSPFQLVELFAEFTPDSVEAHQEEPARVDAMASRFRRLDSVASNRAVRICFAQFKPRNPTEWPTAKEVGFLTDVTHSYSDLVPIPIVARSVYLNQLDGFRRYLLTCLDAIERLNNKPLLGWVPVAMPRDAIGKILDIYLEHDVRGVVVDFGGRIPDPFQLRGILPHLVARGHLDDFLLYGLNPRPGRFVKNANEIPSRDFFGFGYGLDVLGGSHLRAFMPPISTSAGLSRKIAARAGNRKRLFSRATYGYHKVSALGQGSDLFPRGSPVKLSSLLESPGTDLEKAFNMDQQATEASVLARRLASLGKRESVLDYVRDKRLATSEIPAFRRVRTLD